MTSPATDAPSRPGTAGPGDPGGAGPGGPGGPGSGGPGGYGGGPGGGGHGGTGHEGGGRDGAGEGLVGTGRPGELLPGHTEGPRAFGWWGMAWLIATEATLFGLLLAGYFYLRFRNGRVWPPDGLPEPELGLVLVMTAVLWSSSIPVHLAERAARDGDQQRLRVGLAAGFLLGAAFLFLTVAVEWPHTLHDFGPTTNAYGSLHFTITGFHAAHVLGGLLFSLWVQARAWQGAFGRHRHLAVQNFTLYWHFVDAVWLFVLVTVYLSPHL